MSYYKDIYRDLPSRVFEVWQRTKEKPRNKRDLSVTAMLMAAAAGLAMPWESLKHQGAGNAENWDQHPAYDSNGKASYQQLLERTNKFLTSPLNDHDFFHDAFLFEYKNLSDIRSVIESSTHTPSLLGRKDVRFAVKIIRNALAHNNIVACKNTRDEIEKLCFFSEKRIRNRCESTLDGWEGFILPNLSFENFLHAWFAMLDEKSA